MEILAVSLILIGLVVILIPIVSKNTPSGDVAYGEIPNVSLYLRACFQPGKIFRFIIRDKDDILEYTHYIIVVYGLVFGFTGLFLFALPGESITSGDPLGSVLLFFLICILPVGFFYGCVFLLYYIGRSMGGLAYFKGMRLVLSVSLFPSLIAWGIFIFSMFMITGNYLTAETRMGTFYLVTASLICLALMIWHWTILVKGVKIFHSISIGRAVATVFLVAMLILAMELFIFSVIY